MSDMEKLVRIAKYLNVECCRLVQLTKQVSRDMFARHLERLGVTLYSWPASQKWVVTRGEGCGGQDALHNSQVAPRLVFACVVLSGRMQSIAGRSQR